MLSPCFQATFQLLPCATGLSLGEVQELFTTKYGKDAAPQPDPEELAL